MSSLKLMLFLPLAALCLPAPAQEPATAQGMVVVRDAQSGQLREPTAAEIRALQASPSGSAPRASAAAAPTMVTGPGGRRSVRLGERNMVYSVVTRDANGKLGDDQCVPGAQAAERALAQPAPATKHEEHRHESR